jgi:nitrous oxidase accessory protein NosD
VCALLAAGAMVAPANAQARTRHVSCGETITTDTTLAADVTNCPDDAIVIGGDDVTLDLNGHTVGGKGTGVGIDDTAGHSGVTIESGTVTGFDVGVVVADAGETRVTALSAQGGIAGILVVSSHGIRVTENAVTQTSGYAIPMFDTSHVLAAGNTLRDDKHGILLSGGGHGVFTGNRALRSGGGVEVDQATDNLVADNLMVDGGDAVGLTDTTDTLVTHNRMSRLGFRYPETGGFGVLLDGSDHVVVRDNLMSHSHGPLIYVTQIEGVHPPADDLIEHNVADDGLIGVAVDFPGTVLSGNEADFNERLGIQAVPGTIDGGGNRARGNGDPRQCTVIACR